MVVANLRKLVAFIGDLVVQHFDQRVGSLDLDHLHGRTPRCFVLAVALIVPEDWKLVRRDLFVSSDKGVAEARLEAGLFTAEVLVAHPLECCNTVARFALLLILKTLPVIVNFFFDRLVSHFYIVRSTLVRCVIFERVLLLYCRFMDLRVHQVLGLRVYCTSLKVLARNNLLLFA